MTAIIVKVWPEGEDSHVLASLGMTKCHPSAIEGSDIAEFIEYEGFLAGIITQYDAMVADGGEDSATAFQRFAEGEFETFRSFQKHWTEGETPTNRLVVPRNAFFANPENWLTSVLTFLDFSAEKQISQQAFDAKVAEVCAWRASRCPSDLTTFRHYSPALFAHLGQLRLGRFEVEEIFQEMMGRAPSATGAAQLQYYASPTVLRQALSQSQEYRQRHKLAPSTVPIRERPANPKHFNGFAAIFDRSNAALSTYPPAPEQRKALRVEVDRAAAAVLAAQQSYQPLYGIEGQSSEREALLLESCALVQKEFASISRKNQIRIVDVGCNAGFVSFSLANIFPNTLGIDVNKDNIALCCALKAHSGSPAMFSLTDLLEIAERTEPELESVDCILFLNVIHQLIFHKGIDHVKSMLGQLSRSVDFMVVELARPAEYVPFGKQDLLPLDPAEILAECRDATITLIKDGKRPVYTIRRRNLTVGGLTIPYSSVRFSEHPESQVNRKYYFGADTFTKVMRYSALQDSAKFVAEVNGLQTLEGLSVAPDLLAWDQDTTMGRVVMRRLYGPSLLEALAGLQNRAKPRLLQEVTRLAVMMGSRGICQNDFSVHNFILLSDGSLRMIDFELSGTTYVRDPFATFSWVASDLLTGEANSYKMAEANALAQPHRPNQPGQARIERELYPKIDPKAAHNVFGADLADILAEAYETKESWNSFLKHAWKRLGGIETEIPQSKKDIRS